MVDEVVTEEVPVTLLTIGVFDLGNKVSGIDAIS
jgi:hypothetical protein